jgi:hypothetical protein
MNPIEAIAEGLLADVTIAIAAQEVFSPAASDAELMKCFQLGLAGPAFDFVRHMVFLSEVMALMRLWDSKRVVRSICTLANKLADVCVVDRLAERERVSTEDTLQFDVATLGRAQRKLPFSPARVTADQRKQELRNGVSKWLADVRSVKSSTEVSRLKKCQDELLAHSAASSKANVQPMQYEDPKIVLGQTIPIVSDLSPVCHPGMSRVGWPFEPVWLGVATGWGAKPRLSAASRRGAQRGIMSWRQIGEAAVRPYRVVVVTPFGQDCSGMGERAE